MFVRLIMSKRPYQRASKCKNCDDSIAHAIYAFCHARARDRFLSSFSFYEISLFFLFAFALISASERKMPFSEKENAKQTSRQQQKDIARFRAQSKLELLALQWQRRRHYHCRRQRNTISWVKHFFLRQYFFSSLVSRPLAFVFVCALVHSMFYLPHFPDHYFNSCDRFSISTVSFRFFADNTKWSNEWVN